MLKRILLSLIMMGLISFSGIAFANVAGSKHDLSSIIPDLDNLCFPCHTPHNAADLGDMPLWQPRSESLPTFQVYEGLEMNATVNQPDGMDAGCMYCHSGTIAMDSFGDHLGAGTQYMTGDAVLGTDLRNDHPVSFDYQESYNNSTNLTDPVDSHGTGVKPFKLYNYQMRCASCHTPHDNKGTEFMLRSSSKTWCSTCHKNK